MIKLTAPERGQDTFGSGAFHASRGSRSHNGVDFAAYPGSRAHTVLGGTVTKLGTAYRDTPNYRYVQVTDVDGNDWRYFYVKPGVMVGDDLHAGDFIGIVQDLDLRYKAITPHIHLEVITPDGEYVNPKGLV